MVELPRDGTFRNATQIEAALAEEAAKAPAAEAPATPVAEAPVAPKKTGGKIVKRGLLAAALLAGAAFGADFGYRYWTVGRFIESTDDAYVKADYTTVAPKVAPRSSNQRHIVPRSTGAPSRWKRSSIRYRGKPSQCFSTAMCASKDGAASARAKVSRGIGVVSTCVSPLLSMA